jgi:3-dehydroquinate synthase
MNNHLTISSYAGKYDIRMCDDIPRALKHAVSGPVHILADRYIWKNYRGQFRDLPNVRTTHILDAVEKNKTLDRAVTYVKFLLGQGIRKNHTILVAGGGQIQDIGSFAAHILLRGVPWVFVPTTLLAMADSCIGSKSALNVGKYKNQVGAFWPPSHVLIFPKFCKTLPESAVRDGKGEILKHALIGGGSTFKRLTGLLPKIPKNQTALTRIIIESLLIKKQIIEKDEFDRDTRKILNYGHTFGHALEGYTHTAVAHGTAVTIGMDMANFISVRRGLLPQKEFDMISTVLHGNIPYDTLPVRSIPLYMKYLSRDKKMTGDTVTALLCRGIGRVVQVPLKLDKQLAGDIDDYRKYYRRQRKLNL